MKKLHRRSLIKRACLGSLAGSATLATPGCLTSDKNSDSRARYRSLSFSPEVIESNRAIEEQTKGKSKKVLIIGGGIAGLSAATTLVDAGYSVTLREAAPFIGGKLHTRDEKLNSGNFNVENAIHFWHHQYYNFYQIMEKIGVSNKVFKPVKQTYVFKNYEKETQDSVETYPENLIALVTNSSNLKDLSARETYYPLHDVFFYNQKTNYKKFDNMSYTEWLVSLGISEDFERVVLSPIVNNTFNDRKNLSAAEFILNLHTQLIGHPKADSITTTTKDYDTAIITPWRNYLEQKGARILTGSPVKGLSFSRKKCTGTVDSPRRYHHTVVATDVPGVKSLLQNSQAIGSLTRKAFKAIETRVEKLKTAPHCMVLRVWFDKKIISGLDQNQVVINTPENPPISKIIIVDMINEDYQKWSIEKKGSVLEFHIKDSAKLKSKSPEKLWSIIKESVYETLLKSGTVANLGDAKALDYSLAHFSNLPSYEVGQAEIKPEADMPKKLGIKNLLFAGDWVRYDALPVAYMERAVTTGLVAANKILRRDGMRESRLLGAKTRGVTLFPEF